jgi:hypothetical protein
MMGLRSIEWEGLAPGESRQYVLNLVGKTAGEYRYSVLVTTGNRTVQNFSGRVVVLP